MPLNDEVRRAPDLSDWVKCIVPVKWPLWIGSLIAPIDIDFFKGF